MENYKVKIGLEIHVQLKTKTKLFCSCPVSFAAKANSYICPVCLGLPGALPVLNEKALDLGIKTALALNCNISDLIQFERKNYFYPDLPKGYQISQYRLPLAKNGFLEIPVYLENNLSKSKKIRINRVHLEEDAGKLIHKKDYSLVDYNRAGVPLLEIVTEPDIESPEQAQDFLIELKTLLLYIGVSDCDMEKGELRCDANISICQGDSLGTKVEIKNMNSFKGVKDALSFEKNRQKELIKKGQNVVQETRLWSAQKGITLTMRKKEESPDYRYFPEPDLRPFKIEKERIEKIKKEIPELPFQKRERFKKEYSLDFKTANILARNKETADFFEKVISELDVWENQKKSLKGKSPFLRKLAANYLISDLKGLVLENKISFEKIKITPENFAELISLIGEGKISSRIAKEVLRIMFGTGQDPSQIIEEQNLTLINNKDILLNICKKVIKENEKVVLDFKKGKENALQFLIGKVMAQTKGKADPIKVKEILMSILSSGS